MQSKAPIASSSRFVPLFPKFASKFVSREFKKFQQRPPSRPMTAERRSTTKLIERACCHRRLSIRNRKISSLQKTNSLTKPLRPSSTRTVLSVIHTTSSLHDGLHVLVVKIVNLRLRLERRLPPTVEDTLLPKDRCKMNGN